MNTLSGKHPACSLVLDIITVFLQHASPPFLLFGSRHVFLACQRQSGEKQPLRRGASGAPSLDWLQERVAVPRLGMEPGPPDGAHPIVVYEETLQGSSPALRRSPAPRRGVC